MSKLDPDKIILMDIGDNIKVGDVKNIGWDRDKTEKVKITKIYEIKFTGEANGTYALYCDVIKYREAVEDK